jgi:very-short-patch-repair endonuclease
MSEEEKYFSSKIQDHSSKIHEHFSGNLIGDVTTYHMPSPCKCECVGLRPDNFNVSHPFLAQTSERQRETIVRAYRFVRSWTPSYWSPVERAFIDCQSEELKKAFVHNFEVKRMDGKSYYVDFALPDQKIGIEVDEVFHSRPLDKLLDTVRQKTLEKMGWTILRVPQSKLRNVMEELSGIGVFLER